MAHSPANMDATPLAQSSATITKSPRGNLVETYVQVTATDRVDNTGVSGSTVSVESASSASDAQNENFKAEKIEDDVTTYYIRRKNTLWNETDSLHHFHRAWLASLSKEELKKHGYTVEEVTELIREHSEPGGEDDEYDYDDYSDISDTQYQEHSASQERHVRELLANTTPPVVCTHEDWCECAVRTASEKGVKIPHLGEWALAAGYGIEKEVSTEDVPDGSIRGGSTNQGEDHETKVDRGGVASTSKSTAETKGVQGRGDV
jgi:hypothetical protein